MSTYENHNLYQKNARDDDDFDDAGQGFEDQDMD